MTNLHKAIIEEIERHPSLWEEILEGEGARNLRDLDMEKIINKYELYPLQDRVAHERGL